MVTSIRSVRSFISCVTRCREKRGRREAPQILRRCPCRGRLEIISLCFLAYLFNSSAFSLTKGIDEARLTAASGEQDHELVEVGERG